MIAWQGLSHAPYHCGIVGTLRYAIHCLQIRSLVVTKLIGIDFANFPFVYRNMRHSFGASWKYVPEYGLHSQIMILAKCLLL